MSAAHDLRRNASPSAEAAQDPGVGDRLAPRVAADRITVRAPAAAEMLDVSPEWLRRNATKVGIPHVKVAGVLLFPVEGLREWARRIVEAAA